MKLNNALRPYALKVILGTFAALVLYYFTLFDANLLWLVETVATKVNGARIEAHGLKTSLWKGSFQINGLSIANPFNPSENIVQFDRVNGRILIAPLFRRKLVVDSVDFIGAHFFVERQSYGGLVAENEDPNSIFDRTAPGFTSPVMANIAQTPLRLLGHLETSSELKGKLSTTSNLSTYRRFDELSRDIAALTKLKDSVLSDSESHKKLAELSGRLERLKAGRSPSSVSSDSWVSLHRDALLSVAPLSTTLDQVRGRFNRIRASLDSLDPFIRKDVAQLKSQMHLPNLDGEDLSIDLFTPSIMHYLDRTAYWLDVSRRRMPGGTPKLVRQNKARGAAIHFGHDGGWPAILVRRITFVPSDNNASDSMSGELTNLTSDPSILQSPLAMSVVINSPHSAVSNLKLDVNIDHRTTTPHETINISADSIPVRSFGLNESYDLKFLLASARLHGTSTLDITGDSLSLEWDSSFEEVKYNINSRYHQIQSSLEDAVGPVTNFNLSGRAEGPFTEIRFTIRSELGKSIAEKIHRDFKHQISAFDETLRSELLDKVDPKRKSLQYEIDTLEQAVTADFQSRITLLKDIATIAMARAKKIRS
ncbi:MAG: hypothetical protein HYR96_14610 [Deltaproteobacteria bacterium]|nr:hypothetical protein [Deltaproteobacteria bacterium]MBI3294503.1 hypothetical protein [Deltaproteobacteria bacterium]